MLNVSNALVGRSLTSARAAARSQSGRVLAAVLLAAIATFPLLNDDQRIVAIPALAGLLIPVAAIALLWARDGRIPVFDLGAVCILVTSLYAVVPLVNFLVEGARWTVWSDNRLVIYNPHAADVSRFAWRSIVYLATLALAYVVARGHVSVRTRGLDAPGRATTLTLGVLFAALSAYSLLLRAAFNVTYAPSYVDLRSGIGLPTALPYVVQQVSHNLYAILLVVKQGFLIVLLRRWSHRRSRTLLFAWLGLEMIMSALRLGARTEVLMLLLSAGLLYDRIVRPARLRVLLPAFAVLLTATLAFGIVRDWEGGATELATGPVQMLSANNEFQSLFATAYDIQQRERMGTLGSVPWQLYVSELTQPVPSQLLPFQKVDPAEWYLDVLDARNFPQGYMFGVVSQSILGFGWIELIVRGLLLGLVMAAIHKWYVRHATSFLMTLFYLFLCSWSYYTFRSTTFSVAYMVLYRFVPLVVLLRAGAKVFGEPSAARCAARTPRWVGSPFPAVSRKNEVTPGHPNPWLQASDGAGVELHAVVPERHARPSGTGLARLDATADSSCRHRRAPRDIDAALAAVDKALQHRPRRKQDGSATPLESDDDVALGKIGWGG